MNLHALRHSHLKAACIPISPLALSFNFGIIASVRGKMKDWTRLVSRKTNLVLLTTTLFDATGIETKQGSGSAPASTPVLAPQPIKIILSFQTGLFLLVGDEGLEPPTLSV